MHGKPLRAAARAALLRESKRPGLATAEETRELIALFQASVRDRQLTEAERDSTRHAIRNRLLAIERGLKTRVKAAAKAERMAQASRRRNRTTAAVDDAGPYSSAKGATAKGAAGGGAAADNAQQLIELIQATIDPDSWDVNGGEGTIVYYRPLQVLVVRNTGEVHHGVGGVLGGVRP